MSLDPVGLSLIAPHLRGASVLALGYPDLTATRDEATAILGAPPATAKWNTASLFGALGVGEFDAVDVIAHKGFERIVDLNEPQAWPRRYSLVINPGTLEHCFNLGQAFANAWSAIDVGGHVLHVAPASMLNHGFWNLCPVAIEEWCRANGGRVRRLLFAKNGTREPVEPDSLPRGGTGRKALPPETVMYALCEKVADLPMRWPSQAVYRKPHVKDNHRLENP